MTYLLVAAVTTDLFTDKLTAHTLFGLSQFLSSAQNKTFAEKTCARDICELAVGARARAGG